MKYSIAWQVARVMAKRSKDIESKVGVVMTYYNNRRSWPAYERVDNWFRMLAAGCKHHGDYIKEAYLAENREKDGSVRA